MIGLFIHFQSLTAVHEMLQCCRGTSESTAFPLSPRLRNYAFIKWGKLSSHHCLSNTVGSKTL